ncbi:MAG: sulfate ABC transporter permease subunit CysT [Deltaproteobacteria bacterium]|nr:sulfate ABC transporter permease subunit CysT [Deltaproteobacteria bacterium]
MLKLHRSKNVLPGFGITLGFTIFYLSLVVLIPISMLFFKTATMTAGEFWSAVTSARVLASYRLSFGAAFAAAGVNLFFGLLVAWVLARYTFPGKKIIDGIVDLPFALPTSVAGITLTALYASNGAIGGVLGKVGIEAVFTPLGVVIALAFISFPFVVRTVQPVLEDLDHEIEEAAVCLGATRWQTFSKVIFPILIPSLISGFALAFARALGEYGSVVFISGNMPMKTEITPLLIITKLEQYDYSGATAIAVTLLAASFLILLLLNILQWRAHARHAGE